MDSCPRVDLLSCSEEQRKMKVMVNKLPKYCTFDHTFHALRSEERYWFLKTKPIRHRSKTSIEHFMTLSSVMRRSDGIDNIRKDKLRGKDYELLAKVIGGSSPVPESLLAKNSLEKRPRFRTESENLRAAVSASKTGAAAKDVSLPGGPMPQKNVSDRLQNLMTHEK